MHPTVKRLSYMIALLVLLANAASGGVLNGHGSALTSGNHVFTGISSKLAANVDYAVFTPGVFTGALALPAAEDPSGGSQYVYAYEIFNTGVPVISFSVGLGPDVITSATNWGDAPSGGGLAPFGAPLSGFFPGSYPIDAKTNVKWHFSAGIGTGAHSNFLLFTSPLPPGLDTASFTTFVGDTNPPLTDYLPSPVPEPSTFVLSAVAAVGLLVAGYLRRRRV